MTNMNLGVANFIILNKLKDSYYTNNLIEESKSLTTEFLDIVKNSPILQLEFKTFNNIENKYIDNDLMATRYIDNNIKLFEIYTNSEIYKEHEKLNTFITEDVHLDDNKIKLYEAISTLIEESLNDTENINIDNIHESFTHVLNHVKKPKELLKENEDVKYINEEVIEIAVNKYNEKYSTLDEQDKNLIKTLIKISDDEKKTLLEDYKKESLLILENSKSDNDNVKNGILKVKDKINNIKYDKNTIVDDIIGLHEFKKGLI